jgi:hypothetical protein
MVPLGRFTFLTRTSSLGGTLGYFEWSTFASPSGVTPPIAGPVRLALSGVERDRRSSDSSDREDDREERSEPFVCASSYVLANRSSRLYVREPRSVHAA